jgi:hypothetical protein
MLESFRCDTVERFFANAILTKIDVVDIVKKVSAKGVIHARRNHPPRVGSGPAPT